MCLSTVTPDFLNHHGVWSLTSDFPNNWSKVSDPDLCGSCGRSSFKTLKLQTEMIVASIHERQPYNTGYNYDYIQTHYIRLQH